MQLEIRHIIALLLVAWAVVSIAACIARTVGIRLPTFFSPFQFLQARWGQFAGTALYFTGYIILPLVIGIWLMVNPPMTRSPKWQVHIGNRPDTRINAPVTIANNTLFVAAVEPQSGRYPWSANNYLQALDADTGRFKWHFEVGGYSAAAPVVEDGIVIYSPFPLFPLQGVDAMTGVPKWQFSVANQDLSQPVVQDGVAYMACDCRIYAGLGPNGRVLAIDVRSGKSKWEIDLERPRNLAPAVSAQTIFYVDEIGLHAVDREAGKEQWTYTLEYRISNAPVVVGETVYLGASNELYALNAKTGEERWHIAMERGVIWSVTVVNETAYIGVFDFCDMFCWRSVHFLFAVDLLTHHVKWRFDDGPGQNPIVENRGTIYFAGMSGLWALNRETGEVRWRFQSGGSLRAPTLANGMIYVGDTKGDLYAIPID